VIYYYIKGHPKANDMGMVAAPDVGEWDPGQPMAKDAPIMMDRYYENTKALDGTDIGSRRKFREYLKATGLTHASDFKNEWKGAAEHRKRIEKGDVDHKERREAIERAIYLRNKP